MCTDFPNSFTIWCLRKFSMYTSQRFPPQFSGRMYFSTKYLRPEQFLQVGWLYRAFILLGLALCFQSTSVFSVLMVLYRYLKNFCLHPFLYLLVSWAWWDWPLTWLTNHRPSVLWHCWLGHVTRKTVSEMSYYVSSGALNSTILLRPYPQNHHKTPFGGSFNANLLYREFSVSRALMELRSWNFTVI